MQWEEPEQHHLASSSGHLVHDESYLHGQDLRNGHSLSFYFEHLAEYYFLSRPLPNSGATSMSAFSSLNELDPALAKKCSNILLLCKDVIQPLLPKDTRRCIGRQCCSQKVVAYVASVVALVVHCEYGIHLSRHTLFHICRDKKPSAQQVPQCDRHYFAREVAVAAREVFSVLQGEAHPYVTGLATNSLVDTLQGSILVHGFHPVVMACATVFGEFAMRCSSDERLGPVSLLSFQKAHDHAGAAEWFSAHFSSAVITLAEAASRHTAEAEEGDADQPTNTIVHSEISYAATRNDYCAAVLAAATRELCCCWVQLVMSQHCPVDVSSLVAEANAPDLRRLVHILASTLGCTLAEKLYLHLQVNVWNRQEVPTRAKWLKTHQLYRISASPPGSDHHKRCRTEESHEKLLSVTSLSLAVESVNCARGNKGTASNALLEACMLALQQPHLADKLKGGDKKTGLGESENAASSARQSGPRLLFSQNVEMALLPQLTLDEVAQYIRQDTQGRQLVACQKL